MKKIASFTVNHDKLNKGMYISRIDGDVITYDIRMKKPNGGDYLGNGELHTFEHLFVTYAKGIYLLIDALCIYLFIAIDFNCTANKFGCASSSCLINAACKVTSTGIHRSKTIQYCIGAGVKICGYKILQLLYL